jgi:signal transduction histidine kinase
MRLVTRLTGGFLAVVICSISLHEVRQFGAARADFERDMDRSHRLVATTLADAVEGVLPHEGPAGALATVETTNQRRHGDLTVRWVCRDHSPDAPPPPLPCAALDRAEPVTFAHQGRRYTLAAVHVAGVFRGAIEVSEAPDHEGQWARGRLRQALVLAAMTVAAMTAAAFVLGLWLVARPTRALAEKARAVGRGDLEPDLHLPGRGELSTVAAEMNAMCRQLRRERARADLAVERMRQADRLATVGRLASGLAHELGTPLNVIEARAGIILDDPAAEPPVQRSARVIIECTEQVTRLLRQLLSFVRPRELEFSPLSLDGLAGTVTDLLRPLAEKRGVVLAVDPGAAVMARADAVLLQQAVMNLVVNALHACVEGGRVSLRAGETSAPRPGIDGPSVRWLTLAVRDDGAGMTDAVRAAIFEPFFTTRAAGEGTGLGVPIVASILEDHGGFMTIESAVGRGSTFTIHLPPGDDR